MKGRNTVIDIMKGIGIILMVVGHAGCPTFLYNFIYTFHMPLFFMISGCLISGSKPNLIKRIKALYWPFLFWNILSLIMQYPLYKLGIYSRVYDLNEYIRHFVRIVTFAQAEPIVGQLWFLKSLFFSYLFLSIIIWGTRNSEKMFKIIGVVCFILLCCGFYLYKEKGFVFYNIQREM
ncbi:acyltransferase family protein, partial [Bacteroides caecigallinarum]|uniref:acyltransferase family protein n=1 Tax=Bacteroides caecigallinarum TaxID=1411144 RepID=UPI00195E6F2D